MAAGDGLVSMTPTSIAHSGTSASINADGGVDFTAVTSLSLNGVFTSEIDNYLIVFSASVTANTVAEFRLRAAGSDATAANYTWQWLQAGGSTVDGLRVSSDTEGIFGYFSTSENGVHMHVYGPALAQPTAVRGVNVASFSGARLMDTATTHSLSTAYDGITFFTGTFTGNVHVFGYEE
jgi:hypothetical protein